MSPPNVWTDERLSDRFEVIETNLSHLANTVETAMTRGNTVLIPQMLGIETEVKLLKESVARLHKDLENMAEALRERDAIITQERASNKRALWALTGTLLVALIGAAATIIAAGLVGG